MKNISPIQYNKLRKIIDSFKGITQASYNLSLINKKYPLDSLSEKQANELFKVYQDIYFELEYIMNEKIIFELQKYEKSTD